MSRWKQLGMVVFLVAGLAAGAGHLRAQEPQEPQEPEPGQATQEGQDQNKPKPAGRGIPGLVNDQSDQGNDQWQPDLSPVTGLIAPTLGAPTLRHSYWAPGAQYGLMVKSTPFGETTSSSNSWSTTQFIGGTLSLVKVWNESTLDLNYSGGGVVTTLPGQSSGTYQQLAASQSFHMRRWLWQWSNQFAYLPQSQFGFGVGTGLAVPGIGGSLGPNTSGALPPGQSIYSAVGPRYSNMFLVQGTYTLNGRNSFTVAGMDAFIHFTQAQNANNDNYLGSVGWNYAVTKVDSVGLMYRFSSYHFPNEPEAYGDSSISVAYQRKVTQKLGLQAYVGPDFISSRLPLSPPAPNRKETTVQGNVMLSYGFRQGTVSASYFHGITAGSGVLLGGETDTVTVGGGRQISRTWSANVNVGYARNKALVSGATLGFPSYDSVFAGGGVAHPLGRTMDLNFAYTAYIERPSGVCTSGINCGTNTTQQTITVFLNWHARPFVIE